MSNFKNNIGELLEKKGITQRDLADLIGTTEVSVSRYVNSDRIPKCTTCIQIAKVLDCKVEELYTLQKEKEQASAGMTEQEVVEAIKFLKGKYPLGLCDRDEYENTQIAIKALETMQKLKKRNLTMGDLENYIQFEDECVKKNFTFKSLLEAREKQIPKEVKFEQWIDTKCDCGHIFSVHHGDGYHSIPYENQTSYCPNCGQKLNWGEEE